VESIGVRKGELELTDEAVLDSGRYYPREAGVRSLERELGKICRKVVHQALEHGQDKKAKDKSTQDEKRFSVTVTVDNLNDYLGVRRYTYGEAKTENKVGQVTGLAWTEVGGDLLTIEVADMPGKGRVQRTGSIGDVMKESVEAA